MQKKTRIAAPASVLGPALAALGWFSVCAPVSAQTFVPARLEALSDGESLECPSVPEHNSVLFCQAEISETGAVNNHDAHCFGLLGYDQERANALRKRVVASHFEPASIDGKAVKVYVSLRVFFTPANGQCDVTVVPNLGNQEDEFGVDYFGPQEIYTNGGWPMRVERHLEYGDATGMAFAMSVAVDALGRASDGRVEVNNFTSDESVRRAVNSLLQQRFIPAFVDGVPRPARYVEFIYVAEGP